jgi:branched-chain amino acid transport system substrate-binding protein
MIAWLKELDRQNLHPTLSGLSGMGSQEIWDAVGELCIGAWAPSYSAHWVDTDIQLVQKIHELNAGWYPEVEWQPGDYVRAFADFLTVAEALERAIDKVGYQNLNGEAMKDAMETIRDFDPMGLGTGYTWTPNDHQGLHANKWYEWTEDGRQKPVSDWYVYDPLPEERRTNAWWLQD